MPFSREPRRHALGFCTRAAIDDAANAGVASEQIEKLCRFADLWRCANMEIGPVETGDERLRGRHFQRTQNVGPSARIRSGRQRQARDCGELIREARQPAIFRAELVSPMRDTMRFIDGKQRQPQSRQPFQHAVRQQPFRRDVEQIELLLDQITHHTARFCEVEIGMQCAGRYAELAQRCHLVVHKRDQRRDHHCGARPTQRGDLEADALAPARGREHQRVAAGHHMTNYLFLLAAKSRETKYAAQDGSWIIPSVGLQQRLQHDFSVGRR